MTAIEQNKSFVERWNSYVVKLEATVFPKYEDTPIVLDDIQKMKLVEVGDKITSPTGLSSFIVIRISGHELITRRKGKTGVRSFRNIVPSVLKYNHGFYTLNKLIG